MTNDKSEDESHPYGGKKKQRMKLIVAPKQVKSEVWTPVLLSLGGTAPQLGRLSTLLVSTLDKEILSNEDLILLDFQNLMVTLSELLTNVLQLGMNCEIEKVRTDAQIAFFFLNHVVILDNLNGKFSSRSNVVVWRTINLIMQFHIFYM